MNNTLLTFFLLLFFSVRISAQTKERCQNENLAFKAGEVLKYLIQYNWGMIWVDAAEANFKIEKSTYQNKACYHIQGSGSTFSKYDWFYKVRDKFESYSDTSTLFPFRYIRDSNEGGNRVYNDNYFNHVKRSAVIYSINKKGTVIKDTVKTGDCIFDVLSAIYHTRTIDFNNYKAGDKIPVQLYLDGKIYSQQITIVGREVMQTKLGTFNCLKIKGTLVEGTIFKAGDEMTIWITDDKNRIPLYIETPIVIGSIKVSLVQFSGERNPISYKIKK